MRQSLQLRLGQQLTMTPQLQQAIRLLQLSSLDLQAEIQNVLESNIMLEPLDDDSGSAGYADNSTAKEEPAGAEPLSPERSEALGDEVTVDAMANDIYDPYDGATAYSRDDSEQADIYERQSAHSESLHDYLLWQMQLTPFSETDLAIATAIIDAIDESGYLSLPLEEIWQGLKDRFDVGLDEVAAVLHRIQHFDPPGVAARTPAECLRLQLDALAPDTPWLSPARELVDHYLELLAGRDFTGLMRKLKVSREALEDIVALIQSLNPHPGAQYASGEPQFITPDVFVIRQQNGWRVALNPEHTPRLRINASYARLVRRADNSVDNANLRTHLQEARWFLKSLKNRNETLLRVAASIVERQRDFFDHGEEQMKPLVLRDIATALDMHESTISRVTTHKYMHTPRGIYEFKYFFSSHLGTSDGGERSAVAIRAMIRKLIQGESSVRPLSDSKIADLLNLEGVQVARRTVAKYRETMSIPSSSDRKRLS